MVQMPPRKNPGEKGEKGIVQGKDFNQDCRPVHFHRLPDTCRCKPCSCGNKKTPNPASDVEAKWSAVLGKK